MQIIQENSRKSKKKFKKFNKIQKLKRTSNNLKKIQIIPGNSRGLQENSNNSK
jgi:hypothetical protein